MRRGPKAPPRPPLIPPPPDAEAPWGPSFHAAEDTRGGHSGDGGHDLHGAGLEAAVPPESPAATVRSGPSSRPARIPPPGSTWPRVHHPSLWIRSMWYGSSAGRCRPGKGDRHVLIQATGNEPGPRAACSSGGMQRRLSFMPARAEPSSSARSGRRAASTASTTRPQDLPPAGRVVAAFGPHPRRRDGSASGQASRRGGLCRTVSPPRPPCEAAVVRGARAI